MTFWARVLLQCDWHQSHKKWFLPLRKFSIKSWIFHSPKSEITAQKENSPRIGSAGAAGTGSGSGTEKDKSSGSAGGTKSQRSRLRSNRLPLPPTTSSSEDEYDLHKRKSRTISSTTRRHSRDNLLMTTEYKSSTNPRKSHHQKSSPKPSIPWPRLSWMWNSTSKFKDLNFS